MGDGRLRRLPLVALLSLLLIGALAGCSQVQIENRPLDASNALAPEASSLLSAHDLTVLAIDFDPPLETVKAFADLKNVSLLVAVENTGRETERGVTVRVELRADNRDLTPALSRTATIETLSPGEVKIVRLIGLSDIPVRSEYWLKVRAFPVAGEDDVTDNQRIYRVQLGNIAK